MAKITVMVGISGSGKSTLTKKILENTNTIRVNRDTARLMLFGAEQSEQSYYQRKDFKDCENLVTETIDDTVYNALNKGKDIVFDNTHLQKKGHYTSCSRKCSYEILSKKLTILELKNLGDNQIIKYYRK